MSPRYFKLAQLLTIAVLTSTVACAKKKEYALTGPTGILVTFEKKGLVVDATEPGSPADGKLKKGDVNVPGLDEAMGHTLAYVEYHINQGGFPYGFHGPRNFDFNNNGTSRMAATSASLDSRK
jgi:hypothetical protein